MGYKLLKGGFKVICPKNMFKFSYIDSYFDYFADQKQSAEDSDHMKEIEESEITVDAKTILRCYFFLCVVLLYTLLLILLLINVVTKKLVI